MSKIFISYAKEDAEFAKRLYSDLKRAGADPWLDSENLLPGERWKEGIRHAIKNSDFFAALMSSNSTNKKGYVQKELLHALDLLDELPVNKIFVIPIRLEECNPIHEKLSELHWVDFFPSYEIGLKRVMQVLQLENTFEDIDRSVKSNPKLSSDAGYKLFYDNKSEDPYFRSWGKFSTVLSFDEHIILRNVEYDRYPPDAYVELVATSTECIGINKALRPLSGKARFEYQAVNSDARNPNLLFCVIPMKGEPIDLLEVGAEVRSDPDNAFSPYRARYFVPHDHIGDNQWHNVEIDFDFRSFPEISYSIFAPRINEGCPRPGAGKLYVKNLELLIRFDYPYMRKTSP